MRLPSACCARVEGLTVPELQRAETNQTTSNLQHTFCKAKEEVNQYMLPHSSWLEHDHRQALILVSTLCSCESLTVPCVKVLSVTIFLLGDSISILCMDKDAHF